MKLVLVQDDRKRSFSFDPEKVLSMEEVEPRVTYIRFPEGGWLRLSTSVADILDQLPKPPRKKPKTE